MTAPRRIVVCADDFGQGPAVDRGILALARAGRLGAVSCLATGAAFAADAPALAALSRAVAAGLPLDLAEGRAALAALLARTAARALRRRAVEAEIERQVEAFERATGRPPAFVDGHQHVHQLPVVRDALLAVLARRGGSRPWVRSTVPARARGAKALAVAALGGYGLRRALRRAGVRHNRDFAGVYGLDARAGYRRLVQGWLAGAADGALLMCHPGEGGDIGDPIAGARAAELAYLGSPAFEEDCARAGVVRVPFGALDAT